RGDERRAGLGGGGRGDARRHPGGGCGRRVPAVRRGRGARLPAAGRGTAAAGRRRRAVPDHAARPRARPRPGPAPAGGRRCVMSTARRAVPVLADSVRRAGGAGGILDRRGEPFERPRVRCTTVEDVAVAIERMVTQSSGTLFAATAGMALAAREARHAGPGKAAELLRAAGRRLIATRPTNNHIRDAVHAILAATADGPLADADGERLAEAVAAAAAAH